MASKMPSIEIVNVVVPDPYLDNSELIEVVNNTSARHNLAGWRLEILGTFGKVLVNFKLPSINSGGFDPGEHLFLYSPNDGRASPPEWHAKGHDGCKIPHWDIAMGNKPVMKNEERLMIRLIDGDGHTLDTYLIKRGRGKGIAARRVFIGHGRAGYWRELKAYLEDHLSYEVEVFEAQPRAGQSITDVLRGFLSRSGVALLLLTKDDFYADGSAHARENVIHELGLFQGRLGFEKAIAILEDGVADFSNMHGVQQIRFPSANIRACFGDVVAALKREVG